MPLSIVPAAKANEIRMKRSQHMGSFLLVEGRDDRLFMEPFIGSACKIEVAQGKDNVCAVIEILEHDNFRRALGMVDADFDRIEGKQDRGLNIVMPEGHDLETMLILSPALDRILVEFGSSEKLEVFPEDVRKALFARALPLGRLRLYSFQHHLDLKFHGMNYAKWIDRKSFQPSIPKLIRTVRDHSQRHDLPEHSLEAGIREMANAGYHPREICNGTDLIEILAIGLRGRLGNNSATAVRGDVLRYSLRLAYAEQSLWHSDLGKAIRNWESRSRDFQVLRQV